MNKVVSFEYPARRVDAIEMHLEERGKTLEGELEACFNGLYSKVDGKVKKFVEKQEAAEKAAAESRAGKKKGGQHGTGAGDNGTD